MKPQVGSQVVYTLASGDAEQINRRRADADAYRRLHPAPGATASPGHPGRTGFVAHFGNQASEGDVYPAVVVRDWDEAAGTVNLQVLLDGNDTYWATSRTEAREQWPSPGQWCVPLRPPLPNDGEAVRPKPSIGRIVHYVSHGTPGGEYKPACRAAVITEVPGEFATVNGVLGPKVGLCVLNPAGQFHNGDVQHDPGTDVGSPDGPLCGGKVYHGGTWHWPERLP